MAMTDTQRIAIAALARAILNTDLPERVEHAMLEAFKEWPPSDSSEASLEVVDLVKRELACFAQVRRKMKYGYD